MDIPQPGNHINQMLIQTRWHHVQLSYMADAKANMMLTVASVVITLSIRYLAEPHLRFAAGTMILACIATILLSAYAAMPKRPILHLGEAPPDPHAMHFNLLYFGDFSRLSYDEFSRAMETVMNDPSKTYEVQVREIHLLGCFLEKHKFRYVRMAYLAFILGMAASSTVFIAAEMLKK